MTSPGDPIYIAAQIIQACEQGVHNPQLIPRTDQMLAARLIVESAGDSAIMRAWLPVELAKFPTTQTLFTEQT